MIQKRIRSLKKKDQTTNSRSEKETSCNVCFSKRSAVKVHTVHGLPKGLVELSSFVSVKINGHACDAFLDSGSQLIITFEDWYQKNVCDLPIHPVSGLAIWGLSDSSYPY